MHLIELLMEPGQHASRIRAHVRPLVAQALQHAGFERLEQVLRSALCRLLQLGTRCHRCCEEQHGWIVSQTEHGMSPRPSKVCDDADAIMFSFVDPS